MENSRYFIEKNVIYTEYTFKFSYKFCTHQPVSDYSTHQPHLNLLCKINQFESFLISYRVLNMFFFFIKR